MSEEEQKIEQPPPPAPPNVQTLARIAAQIAVELDVENPGFYKAKEQVEKFKEFTGLKIYHALRAAVLDAASCADIAVQSILPPSSKEFRAVGNFVCAQYGITAQQRLAFAIHAAEALRNAEANAESEQRAAQKAAEQKLLDADASEC